MEEMFNERGYELITNDNNEIISKSGSKIILGIKTPFEKMTNAIIEKTIIPKMKSKGASKVVVISERKPRIKHSNVEVFSKDQLFFNISKHFLQPKMKKIKDTPEGFEDFGYILSTDPIVKFYDWKVGNVIKITRDDSLYFRVVRLNTLGL